MQLDEILDSPFDQFIVDGVHSRTCNWYMNPILAFMVLQRGFRIVFEFLLEEGKKRVF